MQNSRPPAAYWVCWVAVLALLGTMLNSIYSRLYFWWGFANFSDENMTLRVGVLAATALLYAALIYHAAVASERVMAPFVKLSRFLKDVWSELQRVVWPSHEETYAFTVVVLIAIVVVGIWVGLLDAIFVNLMRFIY